MKIVVAGGRDEADFLIGLLLMGKHKLVAINGDMAYCEHLASVHTGLNVIYGDPCKDYVMEDAGVKGFDIVIALRDKDADNLEICQMAKRLFGIKKTVCTVKTLRTWRCLSCLGWTVPSAPPICLPIISSRLRWWRSWCGSCRLRTRRC